MYGVLSVNIIAALVMFAGVRIPGQSPGYVPCCVASSVYVNPAPAKPGLPKAPRSGGASTSRALAPEVGQVDTSDAHTADAPCTLLLLFSTPVDSAAARLSISSGSTAGILRLHTRLNL